MSDGEANKAAARRFLETAEHGNFDVLDSIVSPDYVLHDPGAPDEVRGPEGAKQMVEFYRTAFGLRVTIEDQFADGDFVTTRYTMRGTHHGEFMGIPATGREGSSGGICISRFRDGKIVEEWEVFDALSVLQQIGAVPVSPA